LKRKQEREAGTSGNTGDFELDGTSGDGRLR